MAGKIILVRHGETEWSKSGRHTSVTDLPLTENGIATCEPLRKYFENKPIDKAFSSPMQRARTTAEMSLGFAGSSLDVTPLLMEWNYGDYEGQTSEQIHEVDPSWRLWTDGCPNGERPKAIEDRANAFIRQLDEIDGTVACFAHGHILRSLASVWVSQHVVLGERLYLETATISALGYEHSNQAIIEWNSSPTT